MIERVIGTFQYLELTLENGEKLVLGPGTVIAVEPEPEGKSLQDRVREGVERAALKPVWVEEGGPHF